MKNLFFLLLSLLALSCTKGQLNAQQTDPTVVVGKVNKRQPLRQGPAKDPANGYVTLRMGSAEAQTGERVCLPIEATGFTNLIGFQYTMQFDSASLAFAEVRKFDLPGYGVNNFGTRFAERGFLSTLWTDNALAGTNLKTNHRIVEVCFDNLMPTGQSTEVRFRNGPTNFEIVNKQMQELQLVYANGRVTSR